MKKVFLLVAVAMWAVIHCVTAAEKPNILVILCDDLGYADVGFNGATDIKTPELDRLAAGGTIFSSAYVAHPFCGPSRMALMTGRYPHEFGAQYNLPNSGDGLEEYNNLGVPVEEQLISSLLQDAGYYTGAIGKWHMGITKDYHPNTRGFDEFYGFLGGGHNYFPEQYRRAYENQVKSGQTSIKDYLLPLEHNGEKTTETEYLTDALTGEAVRFLDTAAQKKSQPFFLYLAYNAPHAPMEATEEDLKFYEGISDKQRRTYAAMVRAVDRGVGKIVEALKLNNQYENTLIVFLSDNGGRTDQGASNAPLRGVKGDTFEGGFRVPMFFHWPEHVPAQKIDFPVSSLDFYPTFAAMGGATVPKEKKLDGKDVLAAITTGQNPRNGEMLFSMRHRAGFSDVSARREEWKIVRFANQPWRLFNIIEDISESNDLAASNPERVTEMVKTVETWSRTHKQPLWFDSRMARDKWTETDMPKFEETFTPTVGAPPLPPVKQRSDHPVETANSPKETGSVKLKQGDSTKAAFIAQEKIKWEEKGWKWDQSKVEANFDKIDTDGDGIASGAEKKSFWNKGAN